MDLAYCGLNCGECPIYLATVSNNDEGQIRLAREYSTDTCHFSKDDMLCWGCHSNTQSEKMCGDCAIRNCGVKKSCSICAKCNEFPCSILEEYLGENSDSINNLKQLAAKYENK